MDGNTTATLGNKSSPSLGYGLGEVVDEAYLQYLRDIGHQTILSADEERELARTYQEGQQAKEFKLDQLAFSSISRFLHGEVEILVEDPKIDRKIIAGDEAKDHMTKALAPWVIYISQKYRGRGLPQLDIIQNGNIGLMKAIEAFDPERGYRLTTFATPKIRREIHLGFMNQGRLIRLPKRAYERWGEVRRTSHELIQELGHEPTIDGIAAKSFEPPEKVIEVLSTEDAILLSAPVNQESKESNILADIIFDPEALDPEENALRANNREEINKIIAHAGLTKREREMLAMSFELDDDHEYISQRDIARRLGVTPPNVSATLKRAYARLRKSAKQLGFS